MLVTMVCSREQTIVTSIVISSYNVPQFRGTIGKASASIRLSCPL